MKLTQLQKQLKEENIDLALFIYPDSTITYFTQLNPSHAVFIVTPHSAHLFLSALDQKPAFRNIEIHPFKEWQALLERKKPTKVGINAHLLAHNYIEKVKKISKKIVIEDISSTIKDLRAHKNSQEIAAIKKACTVTSSAFRELIEVFSLERFKTELDIALFLENYIRRKGCELAFPTIVANATNSAIPHHQTSRAALKRGFIQLDFGARYNNYCADMSRVLFLGDPTKEEKEKFELLLDAQVKTIDQIKEGMFYSSLDTFARKELGEYSSYFIHSLGHGVGVDIHEEPSFFEEKKNRISSGHVFTIEPGIYFPQKYGLRIEDTLLFSNKAKILTTAPKELVIFRI